MRFIHARMHVSCARASVLAPPGRAVPGDAGDAGLGRSDPPCAWQSDRRMPWACHDVKIRKIQTLFHENEHAFACTGLAAHASRGCRITYMA